MTQAAIVQTSTIALFDGSYESLSRRTLLRICRGPVFLHQRLSLSHRPRHGERQHLVPAVGGIMDGQRS